MFTLRQLDNAHINERVKETGKETKEISNENKISEKTSNK
jgi:hypothetical protein